MPARATPLVIDVDTGIDDAFALLYACASPRARLIGVSTVVGNVDLASVTRNTCAVLALARRAEVPVWPGCAAPMLRAQSDARVFHGPSGLGYAELPEPGAKPAPTHAIEDSMGGG
jgi:purine nucleosidase